MAVTLNLPYPLSCQFWLIIINMTLFLTQYVVSCQPHFLFGRKNRDRKKNPNVCCLRFLMPKNYRLELPTQNIKTRNTDSRQKCAHNIHYVVQFFFLGISDSGQNCKEKGLLRVRTNSGLLQIEISLPKLLLKLPH